MANNTAHTCNVNFKDIKINPWYLSSLTAIKKVLAQKKIVQLQEILSTKTANELLKRLSQKKKWEKTYVPEEKSFSALEIKGLKTVLDFIKELTGKTVHAAGYRFEAGNYTLLHDNKKYSDVFFELDLTKQWKKWKQEWGGYTVLQDNEEILNTKALQNTNATILPSHFNTLTIALNKKDFVKYVNHKAGLHKRIVARGRI